MKISKSFRLFTSSTNGHLFKICIIYLDTLNIYLFTLKNHYPKHTKEQNGFSNEINIEKFAGEPIQQNRK
jgi:hypothetical protein